MGCFFNLPNAHAGIIVNRDLLDKRQNTKLWNRASYGSFSLMQADIGELHDAFSLHMNLNLQQALKGHLSSIYKLKFGQHPDEFLSASGEGLAVSWSLAEWRQHPDQELHGKALARVEANLFAMQVIPDSELLLLGGLRGGLFLVDMEKHEELLNLGDPQVAIFDLLLKGKRLYVALGNGCVQSWDIRSWEMEESWQLGEKSIRRLMALDHHSGSLILASGSDERLFVMDEQGKILQELSTDSVSIFCMEYAEKEKMLITGSRDARLRVWDCHADAGQWTLDMVIPAHNYTINDVVLHPEGKFLATASRDKSIKIWKWPQCKLIFVADQGKNEIHNSSVNSLLWSADGKQLLSASDDRTIGIWSFE